MLAFNKDFYNKIAKISYDHFYKNLPKTGKPNKKEWTVLSVIIKIDTRKFEEWEVVALGTGSKCIGRSKMLKAGDILNDSHAEVVCRRAFLRYLYGQMELCLKNIDFKSIFKLNEEMGKFILDDEVTFHFFTTHVPCGDATIFHKSEGEGSEEHGDAIENASCLLKRTQDGKDNEVPCKRFKEDELLREDELFKDELFREHKTTDVHRTGAKCLPDEVNQDLKRQGDAYHTVGVVRTKPGRGDPTLSVSCSDKLARWCHLGIQGALISVLVDGFIFLSSLTVAGGTHFCLEALERALYKRINMTVMEILKVPVRIEIGQSDLCFDAQKDSERQPCPSSVIWWKSSDKNFMEVAVEGKKQGVTKKHLNTPSGRLKICKKELFSCFIDLVFEMKILLCSHSKIFELISLSSVTYKEAKASSNLYQEKWKVLKEDGFKLWTIKDPGLSEFVNEVS